ncbi:MAG TPA: hypothetical protein VJ183_20025 [Chloroflexia bacterium]|nr:hypothetical protein [Chloroflexia bacterium]
MKTFLLRFGYLSIGDIHDVDLTSKRSGAGTFSIAPASTYRKGEASTIWTPIRIEEIVPTTLRYDDCFKTIEAD